MSNESNGVEGKRFKNNEERLNYLNQQHESLKQQQESDLVIDFDKAIQENKKVIKVVFLGKTYLLSSEMPFSFSTFFMRNCLKKVRGNVIVDIPEDKIVEFVELMFGNEFMEALENCKNSKVSLNLVFETLVPPILEKWGYGTKKIDKEAQKKRMRMMLD